MEKNNCESCLCAAEVYKREVEKMLEEVERQFGTREFKGVHVRVEAAVRRCSEPHGSQHHALQPSTSAG